MRRTLHLILLGLFAGLLIAACGSTSVDVEVSMLDNSFSPEVIRIPEGGTILFRNDGRNPHNAVDAEGTFSTEDTFGSLVMAEGEETELRIQKAGVYQIFCTFHAFKNDEGVYEGMVATVVVGDQEVAEAAEAAKDAVPTEWTGATRHVPSDYPTIQSAVDAADPGDMVLIAPGTYKEAVLVTTPGLTIRGEDRNTVILDGEFIRDNGVFATADGVAVENLTTMNYTTNGVFWSHVTGYRGSYLTSIDNWVYGIYAFASQDGLMEHSYASGSWDSGYYIGECDPCNAMIRNIVSEYNGLGYSGSNSSGNVWIVNSEWRYNNAGIVPNTWDGELLPPVHDNVLAGNYVHHNGIEVVPAGTIQRTAKGSGILFPGALNMVAENNLVVDNAVYGIVVSPMYDRNFWPSANNAVRNNVMKNNGVADLFLTGPAESGSCFQDNDIDKTIPRTLNLLHSCDGINLDTPISLGTFSQLLAAFANGNTTENPMEHGDAPKPPALDFETMPGGADAPVVPAVNVFAGLDTDMANFPLPAVEPAYDGERVFTLGAVPFGIHGWAYYFGALMDWLPWATWVLGGLWAIGRIRRSERSAVAKALWIVAVAVFPVVGLGAYLLFAHTSSLKHRLVVTFGGFFGWLVLLVAGLVAGDFL